MRMRPTTLGLLIALVLIAGGYRGSRAEPATPSVLEAAMPQHEQDYIAAVHDAQAQFESARTAAARKSARQGLQIRLHDLLGLNRAAQGWTGIISDVHTLEDGRKSVEIRIEPQIAVSTWKSAVFDREYATLIERYAPFYRRVTADAVGRPVRFSAELLGARISSDADMVEHPETVARFFAIELLD